MRDLLFLSVFSPLTLLSLIHPWSGLLAFGWLVFLQPDGPVWTSAAAIPFGLVIAVTTAIGWALSRERKTIPVDATLCLLIALVAAAALSTAFSLAPDVSKAAFALLMETAAFLFLLRIMLNSRVRLHGLIWLMAFAMGFFALRGLTLLIVTAGDHQLAGPTNAAIGTPPHLASALLMALPLMNYLRLQSCHRWMQIVLMAMMAVTVTAVLATGSPGTLVGLLAMGAITVFFWWKPKHPIPALVGVLIIGIGLASLAPDRWPGPWNDREDAIETAGTGNSALGPRLHVWQAYAAAALERPLAGAGLGALEAAPGPARPAPDTEVIAVADDRPRAARSMYAGVLGELGFLGFFLYIALLVTGFWNAHQLVQRTRRRPELDWMHDLGRMIQVSMIAFSVTGAVVSMAFHAYAFSLLIVLSAVRGMAVVTLGERRVKASRGERPARRADRPARDGVLVDTTAIAGIWQKAADTKITRLHGRRQAGLLLPRGGAAK